MILDKDINVLKRTSETKIKLFFGVLAFVVLILLLSTYNNISLSIHYAREINLDLSDIWDVYGEPQLILAA